MEVGLRRFVGGLVVGAGVVVSVLLLGQSSADVALAQYGGGTPVNVNAARCILRNGGQATVPPGSLVVITGGWVSGTPGAVQSFLTAQTTIVSVDDGRMIDASADQGPIVPTTDGNYISRFSRSTNVVLGGPGSVMRYTYALHLSRRVTDVFDLDGNGTPNPSNGDAGLSFGGTCTVRAA